MPLKLAKLNNEPEIFHTLQGEGVNTGMPAIFIRSSLCNLHCQWCDTDYTWNWENTPWKHENDTQPNYQKFKKHDYIVELPAAEILKVLSRYPCNNLVLTGGEPLLQQAGWLELLELASSHEKQYHVEIETNGTKLPSPELAAHIDQFNISPKLSNSGNTESLRYQPEVLQWYQESDKAWFKFVVQNHEDLTEVKSIITNHNIDPAQVILMPEGRTPESLLEKRLWLADLCRDHGYRFSDRLHVQLWGSKRGV